MCKPIVNVLVHTADDPLIVAKMQMDEAFKSELPDADSGIFEQSNIMTDSDSGPESDQDIFSEM